MASAESLRYAITRIRHWGYFSSSAWSGSVPGGRSSNCRKCSGRSGSETLFSSLNHLPRSNSLQRCEQNGPYFPSNQFPAFLQVGHFAGFMSQDRPSAARVPLHRVNDSFCACFKAGQNCSKLYRFLPFFTALCSLPFVYHFFTGFYRSLPATQRVSAVSDSFCFTIRACHQDSNPRSHTIRDRQRVRFRMA